MLFVLLRAENKFKILLPAHQFRGLSPCPSECLPDASDTETPVGPGSHDMTALDTGREMEVSCHCCGKSVLLQFSSCCCQSESITHSLCLKGSFKGKQFRQQVVVITHHYKINLKNYLSLSHISKYSHAYLEISETCLGWSSISHLIFYNSFKHSSYKIVRD